jgi:hypothetical protein
MLSDKYGGGSTEIKKLLDRSTNSGAATPGFGERQYEK